MLLLSVKSRLGILCQHAGRSWSAPPTPSAQAHYQQRCHIPLSPVCQQGPATPLSPLRAELRHRINERRIFNFSSILTSVTQWTAVELRSSRAQSAVCHTHICRAWAALPQRLSVHATTTASHPSTT